MGTEIDIAILAVSILTCVFSIVRTYYAKYNKKTYQGSVDYWSSWQKRKFDVAAQVLKEMGIESPEDLKKLVHALKKEKKRKEK